MALFIYVYGILNDSREVDENLAKTKFQLVQPLKQTFGRLIGGFLRGQVGYFSRKACPHLFHISGGVTSLADVA